MIELFIGQIWKNKKVVRTITDLRHEGLDPNDPNDCGSFEEFNVEWVAVDGSKHVDQDWKFEDWVEKTKAVLEYQPDNKVSYRDA